LPRRVHRTLILIFAAGLAPVLAWATPPLERKAKGLGLPVVNCTYCHAFTMDHMTRQAVQMKIAPMNCMACHGPQLPLVGSTLYNDRGRWLVAEKGRRGIKQVDAAWLNDYVPPSPSPSPSRRPR
jgi:hypothetical protein